MEIQTSEDNQPEVSDNLKRDLNDYFNGQSNMYQLKRHLIGLQDDLQATQLAAWMSDQFLNKLMEGVIK